MKGRLYFFLGILGLVVSAAVAAFQPAPGYMDADYYFAGGLQLASGHGFSEPYLWNYLDDPAGLPHPSHAYWMPLASLLAALGMRLSGHLTWFAARLGFLALSSLLPPLTAALSFELTSRRDLAVVSGLLAVFTGYYAPFLPVTDTFGLFMVIGAAFFLIVNRRTPSANFFLGLFAGLMHLSRTDGLFWLLLGLSAVFLISKPGESRNSILHSLFTTLAGYVLVMAPWLVRNIMTFGTPLAPGGMRMLWLVRYNQLFAYPASLLTFQSWWQSGIVEILRVRLWALELNLGNTLAMQGGIFLLPLILIGIWHFRADIRIRLAIIAWLLTLLIMTIAFPFAGARGGFIHSGAALQPMWWALAPVGLDRAITWLARRDWPERKTRIIFQWGIVGISIFLTALIIQTRVLNGWGKEYTAYRQIIEFLVEQHAPENAVIIVANPPGYYLASGRPAIAIPDGEERVVLDVATRYDGRYLILEANSVPLGLKLLFEQPEGHPGFRYLGEVEEARIFVIEP